MSKHTHLKIFSLLVGPVLFAQATPVKTANGDTANAPLSAAAPLPTTVAPGPAIARDDLTPEQKEKMKEVDRMRVEKALIDAQLALQEAKRMEEIAPLNAESMKLYHRLPIERKAEA